MRKEMAVHKPPHGDLDVKLLRRRAGRSSNSLSTALQLEKLEALGSRNLGNAIDVPDRKAGHLSSEFRGSRRTCSSRLLVMVRLIAPDCNTPPDAAQLLIAKSLEHILTGTA